MIWIDTREHFKEQIEDALLKMGATVHIEVLHDYTDYIITSDTNNQMIRVQRKTINEVLSAKETATKKISQMTELLQKTPCLLKDDAVGYLVIEEDKMKTDMSGFLLSRRGKYMHKTGVHLKTYYNFLSSIERGGVYVSRVRNWQDTIYWLYAKQEYIKKQHIPRLSRKYTGKEEVVGVLTAMKGIGEKKATKIWDCYEETVATKREITKEEKEKMVEREHNDEEWLERADKEMDFQSIE